MGSSTGLRPRIKTIAPDSPQPESIATQVTEGILADLINRANQALSDGNWTDVEKLRQAIAERAPNHPAAGRIDQQIRTTRAVQLIREATRYADQNNLPALLNVIESLQALDSAHPEVKNLQTLAADLKARMGREVECAALYEQAQHAQAAGRMGAVITLLRHINEVCPNFGDPQGLAGDEIRAETASLVRQVHMIPMTKEPTTVLLFRRMARYWRQQAIMQGDDGDDFRAVSLKLDTFIAAK
ncbi:MAG: hypothetical protein U0694_13855 [Anaerolineae bacterium]